MPYNQEDDLKGSSIPAIKKISPEVIDKIKAFVRKNPYPDAEKVKRLTKALNIEFEQLCGVVWAIITIILLGNEGKGRKAKEFDMTQVAKGRKLEQEHLDQSFPNIAVLQAVRDALSTRITVDHLSEMQDYYTQLQNMEGENEERDGKKKLEGSADEELVASCCDPDDPEKRYEPSIFESRKRPFTIKRLPNYKFMRD